MQALLGRKLGMTQMYGEDGAATPVTLVQAGPCRVVGVRSQEKDGYDAVQLGFETAKHPRRAQAGQFAHGDNTPRYVREIRGVYDVNVGDMIDVSVFDSGDMVRVTGTSKGKGFSGTIKRHNFSRGPKTHGSRNQRRPGSIGGMYPQKVFKGKKMAGRSGNDTVTNSRMRVESVQTDENVVAIKGAVPGARGNLVIMQKKGA